MPRPQITVEVSSALPRRGADSATGTAFMTFAGAAGPTDPVECRSAADATAAAAPAPVALWVGDALAAGAPMVVLVRTTAVDPDAVTEAEWTTGLGKFGSQYGAGQLIIPGVSTAAAHAALLAAAVSQGRCALLDVAENATASADVTTATGLAAAAGAERATVVAPWVKVPSGGTTRAVPASVMVAGLVGRGDAAVGHTNYAPAGDQSRGAGAIAQGVGVTVAYTDTELDSLHDAGVSVIRQIDGVPTLYGWVSISDDPTYRQFSVGRTVMLLALGVRELAEAFLFRTIDYRGHLYAELEGALRGYLLPLYSADALYGETPDAAFDVAVKSVNDAADVVAGRLNAAISVTLSQHTERITIKVVTRTAEGA